MGSLRADFLLAYLLDSRNLQMRLKATWAGLYLGNVLLFDSLLDGLSLLAMLEFHEWKLLTWLLCPASVPPAARGALQYLESQEPRSNRCFALSLQGLFRGKFKKF